MNDGDVEKEAQIFVATMSKILETLHESVTPEEGLQILSAVTAFILCQCLSSAKEADEAYKTFFSVVGKTMQVNEEIGAANWTRGTLH